MLSNIFELQILNSANVPHSLRVIEVPVVSELLLRPVVPRKLLEIFSHVHLAHVYTLHNHEVHIGILVGLDLYWSLVSLSDAIEIAGLVALK